MSSLSATPLTRPGLRTRFLLLLLGGLLLAGCGAKSDQPVAPTQPVEELIVAAMEEFKMARYATALKQFKEITDFFPFSQQSLLAELKSADCHYYLGQYSEAKVLYQQFEKQHPTNEAIPYVMFQIGMSDIKQADRIDRDTTGARNAIQSFSRLLRAFPQSPYTREAQARKRAAEEFLANHEFFVAVFYVKAQEYKSASHRLKYLLSAHPNANIAPKAKSLLASIEAGNPPKIGIRHWLPDLDMADWRIFDSEKNIHE